MTEQRDTGDHESRVLDESLEETFPASDPISPGAGVGDLPQYATGHGSGSTRMLTRDDGTRLFYKDWGEGQPVVFSHGWPLSADAWDGQMLYFGRNGYRVIAHDRRSHGRSDQTWSGNDMDTYADDLAALIETLDLRDAVLVGHSTGGGEVVRYIGRHGTARISRLVLVGAVTPQMLQSDASPDGLPQQIFDEIRDGVAGNRAQFFHDLTLPFYGFNRKDADVSAALRESFWRQGMMGGIKGQYDCIRAFSETDFTADLQRVDVPTLIIHGDDDQIVPIDNSARRTAGLIPDATLKVYEGASHGLTATQQVRFNDDVLSFLRC